MINEILFVHHTHTDIGYTHPQPVVFELHRRFIDEALDLAEESADWPDDCRFRWTCEVTGTTVDWWQTAPDRDRERFLAAVGRGQFEVAGMAWHMTPLMDHAMVLDVLRPVRFFRDLGIPVRSAMNTDVNGLPWGVVDALLDHGITGLSMAINEHFGHALRPWPRAFRWQSPGGRTLLAYNGFIYGVTSDRDLRIPIDMDEARRRVPQWTKLWEERGYPHPFLMQQITNIRYHDNGSPQPALPEFIRRWNESGPEVRLRLHHHLGLLRPPARRAGGSTAAHARRLDRLVEFRRRQHGPRDRANSSKASGISTTRSGLDAWGGAEEPRRERNLSAARRALALYAEHTWGADRSVSRPQSPETRLQQLLKLALAPEGASLARMLRRDGLERLAAAAGGEEPRLLVYNPHPFPVRQSLRLPYLPPLTGAPEPPAGMGIETFVPTGPEAHRIQRQDVVFSDLPDEHAFWSAPIDVPALSYRTIPAADIRVADGALMADTERLSNGRLTVEFDAKAGGVTSLQLDGVEYAGTGPDHLRMGVPVIERPDPPTRDAIFRPIDLESPDWHESWDTDWTAVRHTPKGVEETKAVVEHGRAEVRQTFVLHGGDKVTVIYRLVPDDPALELMALVDKAPVAAPHAIYLPMPTALGDPWRCDFETGGAVVRLDDEQLPYASRHYITTQRWIRIADEAHEVIVACRDAPLWQVGGFTFGRHQDPDGRVSRDHPMLLAWLTNNYWMTNFQADQGGLLRFRFSIMPGAACALGASIREALARARPPAAHVYAGHGPVRAETGALIDVDLGPLTLTTMEPADGGLALTLLNPEGEDYEAILRAALFRPARARRTSLAGEAIEDVSCEDGTVRVTIGPRAWIRLHLEGNYGSA